MAQVSPYLGFFIIHKESFKLLFKNGKLMAPIALLSLLLPSSLLLRFCYLYQTLTNFIMNNIQYSDSPGLPTIAYVYLSLLLLLQITCIIAYAKISHISTVATILVSATSYTNSDLSVQGLCSRVKSSSAKGPKAFGYRTSYNRGMGIVAMIVWMVVISMAIIYPSPVTITITAVVGGSLFVFLLYTSVGTVLSSVVSVVEEKFEGSERAEELIEGQRHLGFMLLLLFNLTVLIVFLGFWLVFGDGLWSVKAVGQWLILVNFFSLVRIYVLVAYTVLYFWCKKYHGDQESGGVGNFGYSKLPNSNLDGGIH